MIFIIHFYNIFLSGFIAINLLLIYHAIVGSIHGVQFFPSSKYWVYDLYTVRSINGYHAVL